MAKQRRRGHGEGSVYQRDDGLWCASVELGFQNGKRRRKIIYGKTEKEVIARRKTLHLQQELGVDVTTERKTVAQICEEWLETVIKPNRRPRTYESYTDMVRRHILPAIGQRPVSKLTPDEVQRMLNTLSASGLSPRTVRYARAILRKALHQAMQWNYIFRNVATMVEVPRVEKFKIQPLTVEQAQSLLDSVQGHRLESLYRVALSLGLRRGEILGLRWCDVDLNTRMLRIEVALQRVQGRLELSAPKTESSVRSLPLPEVLVRSLHAHRQRQAQESLRLGDAWHDHGLVFPSEVGTPMEPRNLLRHFKAVLKTAGLPTTIRFHDLRHSCGTFLIAQGVHPRVVMEILGHSQISVAMNTYGHVFPETQRQAVETVDALFHAQTADDSDMPDARGDSSQLQHERPTIEQYMHIGKRRLDMDETFSLRETRAVVDLLARILRVVN